jgi:mRNA interferase MazF
VSQDLTRARRGEIWLADLGANRSGELGKTRPVIVMTLDELVAGDPADLLIVVPLSASRAASAFRVQVDAVEGVDRPSVAVVTAARAVARSRLTTRLGVLPERELGQVTALLVAAVGGPRA